MLAAAKWPCSHSGQPDTLDLDLVPFGTVEIGEGVDTVAGEREHKGVAACSAGQSVGACAACQPIGAGAADQQVGPGIATQSVVAGTAIQQVGSATALQVVVAVPGEHGRAFEAVDVGIPL